MGTRRLPALVTASVAASLVIGGLTACSATDSPPGPPRTAVTSAHSAVRDAATATGAALRQDIADAKTLAGDVPRDAVVDPVVLDKLDEAIRKAETHLNGMPSKDAPETVVTAWANDAKHVTRALAGACDNVKRSASEYSARPVLRYTFNTTEGYRYSVDYRQPVVTVEEDTVNALPGKTKLQFKLTYRYTVTNLLSDKNAPPIGIANLIPVWKSGSSACAGVQQEIRRETRDEGKHDVVGCAQKPGSGHGVGRVGSTPGSTGAGAQFAPDASGSGEGGVGLIVEVASSDAAAIKTALTSPDGWALDGASGYRWQGARSGSDDTDRAGYCHALAPRLSGTSDYLFALTVDLGCVTATELTY